MRLLTIFLSGGMASVSVKEGEEKSRKFFAGLCVEFGDEEVLEVWETV